MYIPVDRSHTLTVAAPAACAQTARPREPPPSPLCLRKEIHRHGETLARGHMRAKELITQYAQTNTPAHPRACMYVDSTASYAYAKDEETEGPEQVKEEMD